MDFSFCIINLLLSTLLIDWSCYAWKDAYYSRRKRQAGPADNIDQTDVNVTVPFMFSARLYPYGEARKDDLIVDNQTFVAIKLKNSTKVLGQTTDTVFISKDGLISFDKPPDSSLRVFPTSNLFLAPYWSQNPETQHGKVWYRQSEEENVLQLAGSEVQIQYHYSTEFKPTLVLIVTWEDMKSDLKPGENVTNTFQVAVILSNNGTFAHIVYSKLKWEQSTIAHVNGGADKSQQFTFPFSNKTKVTKLANESDIGIPGEWLLKIDTPNPRLCGPGYKGLECVSKCRYNEFSYDCSRNCHCAERNACNDVTGFCPGTSCETGWHTMPICEKDVDECSQGNKCKFPKPDCVNTPGSFECTCIPELHVNTTEPCPEGENSTTTANSFIIVPKLATNFVRPITITKKPIEKPASSSSTNKPDFASSLALEKEKSSKQETIDVVQIQRPSVKTSSPSNEVPPLKKAPENLPLLAPKVVQTPKTENATSNIETPESKPQVPLNIPYPNAPQTSTTTLGPQGLCDKPCAPNAHCEFLRNGTMNCICNRGWSGDGSFCTDINECFLENACEKHARCQNTLGSFTCLCEPGFQSDGKTCVDIDECREESVQCAGGNTSMCYNTVGSYECRCKPGYNGNPVSLLGCIDVNECQMSDHYCGPNAECQNFIGGYNCICQPGYERRGKKGHCKDINECKEMPCHKAAMCYNLPGSFTCTCIEGYSGDGFDCQETLLFPFSRTEDKRLAQEKNAVEYVQLSKPVKILGKSFNHFYISANGIVTFDRSMEIYSELPVGEVRRTGLAPLYQKVDLTRGGGIYVREITDAVQLDKISMTVHDEFHDKDFNANIAFVVTYDDVIQINQQDDSRRSTFQLVVASGVQGTYAIFAYDRISNDKAQIAIVAPEPPRSVVAHVSGSNASVMRETSNIGIAGKWIYRINDKTVIPCPAGLIGAPYCLKDCIPGEWGLSCAKACHCADAVPCDFKTGYCTNHACLPGYMGENCYEDVDECEIGHAKCHPKASCFNTFGSYKCVCHSGWTGDGQMCFEITPCLLDSGVPCSENARCLAGSNNTDSFCKCKPGYTGDGFECFSVVQNFTSTSVMHNEFLNETKTNETSLQSLNELLSKLKQKKSKNAVSTLKITSTTQASSSTRRQSTKSPRSEKKAAVVPKKVDLDGKTATTKRKLSVLEPATATTPQNIVENAEILRNNEDQRQFVENKILNKNTKRRKTSLVTAAEEQNKLMIIIPAVLCAVWLIGVIVLLAWCRKEKRPNGSKAPYPYLYNLPWYYGRAK